MLKLTISNGNAKMGAIPSVSLPPVTTCTNCTECAKKCYARKMYQRYPNVKKSYDNNLDAFCSDIDFYFSEIEKSARMTKCFRWHVSGDIVNRFYFEKMVELAEKVKDTKFLCFTKNYAVVNDYIAKNGTLPTNLKVIFSEWGEKLKSVNPYNLPISTVIFKGEIPNDAYKICAGNCYECACRGVGCWELQNGEVIAFYEH